MLAVVIPYYKKTFFRQTLQSLTDQTDKRFKVYIGNDASPENPDDLIKEFQEKFDLTYHEFQENLGRKSLVKQWERCIALSKKEEWIIILGDDDYFSSNIIESFYTNYDNFNQETNVIRFAKQNLFKSQNIISETQYNPKIESMQDSFYRRITGQTTSTLSEYAFRRNVYQKYKFYDYPLAWHSDNRAWIEFTDKKPIFSINEAVVYVTNSTESITGSSLYASEKRKANLEFFKFVITDKLHLFDKKQSIRILHKYENEIKYKENVSLKTYLYLLPYYIKNFESKSFKSFIKKLLKSVIYR